MSINATPGGEHVARRRIEAFFIENRRAKGAKPHTDHRLRKKVEYGLRLFRNPGVWRRYVELETRRLKQDHFIELPTYAGWDLTLTVEDAAAATGLTVPEVRDAISSGRFRAFHEGTDVRVTESAFWDFKRSLLTGADSAVVDP